MKSRKVQLQGQGQKNHFVQNESRSCVEEDRMAERRALVERLKTPVPTVETGKEKAFVYGAKKAKEAAASETPAPTEVRASSTIHARVPLSTRMREDFFDALKRASLERQLAKVEPNTLQDILEQAVEPWLRANGYLK
jgi:hypothetical protein